MATICTRCEGSGFLNYDQFPQEEGGIDHDKVLAFIQEVEGHDVIVCDCCGDCEEWHGTPGEHYNSEDPQGHRGPYSYNGGLCECH